MDDDIEDYIDCLEGGLRDEVKNIVFALNNDRNQDRDSLNQFLKKSLKRHFQGYIDVGDGCWRLNLLVTTLSVVDGFGQFCHQHPLPF